jgi:hypothetical protein
MFLFLIPVVVARLIRMLQLTVDIPYLDPT